MERCLQLARNGEGRVSPNPLVGSVIVHDDRIIGEGWHQKAGEPHAEVNAIKSVKKPELLSEATIYVNLEPCAHYGKTPPCSDLIIEKSIPRVVIGCRDPFAEVNGKGVAKLAAAGIEVIENILQQEAEQLNRRFFTFHGKKRPYIILKWASSRDGFLDRSRNSGQKGINWITSTETQSLVHQWRSEEDAILVGARTVNIDNPSLTVREVRGKNPYRLVLASNTDLPDNSAIFNEAAPTALFSLNSDTHGKASTVLLQEGDALEQILDYCYQNKLLSLIVEGGAQLLNSFIEAGLWDEARVLTGPGYFSDGLEAPRLTLLPYREENFGHDQICYYRP